MCRGTRWLMAKVRSATVGNRTVMSHHKAREADVELTWFVTAMIRTFGHCLRGGMLPGYAAIKEAQKRFPTLQSRTLLQIISRFYRLQKMFISNSMRGCFFCVLSLGITVRYICVPNCCVLCSSVLQQWQHYLCLTLFFENVGKFANIAGLC